MACFLMLSLFVLLATCTQDDYSWFKKDADVAYLANAKWSCAKEYTTSNGQEAPWLTFRGNPGSLEVHAHVGQIPGIAKKNIPFNDDRFKGTPPRKILNIAVKPQIGGGGDNICKLKPNGNKMNLRGLEDVARQSHYEKHAVFIGKLKEALDDAMRAAGVVVQ